MSTRRAYGEFLTAIFDEWVRHDVGEMFVQFFDGVLAAYVRGYSSLCVLRPTCGEGVALEHNGDLYSCDHFVDAPYLLGNIMETPIGELVRGEKQRAFGEAKRDTLPRYCRECEFLFACNGECPKNRILLTPDGRAGSQLPVRGAEALLRPHGSAHEDPGGTAPRRARRLRHHAAARRGGRAHRPQRSVPVRQRAQVQGMLRGLIAYFRAPPGVADTA